MWDMLYQINMLPGLREYLVRWNKEILRTEGWGGMLSNAHVATIGA